MAKRKKNQTETTNLDGAPSALVLETPVEPDQYLEGILAKPCDPEVCAPDCSVGLSPPLPPEVAAEQSAKLAAEREAENAETETLVDTLREIAKKEAAPIKARLDACEALAKLFGEPDDTSREVLTKLTDQPADYTDRVRACRILLGL